MRITNAYADDSIAAAILAMNDRDRELDRLLPERSFAAEQPLLALYDGDDPLAIAAPSIEHFAAESTEALWGALHQAEIELRWNGNQRALAQLLRHWIAQARAELGDDAVCDSWESSYTLTAPARDSALVSALLSCGFAVVIVQAVRSAVSKIDANAAHAHLAAVGVRLVRASTADIPILAALDTELLQHESQHGRITRRPNETALLRTDIETRLRQCPELTWLIERDGAAVGYLSLETEQEKYQRQIAGGGRLAYLQALYLRPVLRGARVGEAVVDFAHGTLQGMGYNQMMLDYAALNPKSGPFWCRMGYRPLWNTWQRRPAR